MSGGGWSTTRAHDVGTFVVEVRNDTWQEFVQIRRELDAVLAELLADALSHSLSDPLAQIRIGRVIGALRMSLALPHSRSAGDTLHYRLKDAHQINRHAGWPCGCGKLRACVLEGVDARALLEAVACDPELRLDAWQIDQALEAVKPRAQGRLARPPADYDREALDAALLTALAADSDGGMTTGELLEALDEHCDATSARIGARLRVLRDDGVVTDWTFEDGRFERRAWELVRHPTPR